VITIRFASGLAVTYNTATYAVREQSCVRLFTAEPDKGGRLVAYAPYEAIIEWTRPCTVEPPTLTALTLDKALETLATTDALRRCNSWHVAGLKRRLLGFNAKRREWRK
jgi:hypothetical protein